MAWGASKDKKSTPMTAFGNSGRSQKKLVKKVEKESEQVRWHTIRGYVDNGRGGKKKVENRIKGSKQEARDRRDELAEIGWTGMTLDNGRF